MRDRISRPVERRGDSVADPAGPTTPEREGSVSAHDDDRQLVRAVLAADPAARARFAARMQCIANVVAARNQRLRHPLGRQELHDVVQDVWTRVWAKLHAYDGRAALETWVYKFCEYELRNALRRAARHGAKCEPLNEDEWSAAARPLRDGRIDFERVYQGLDELDMVDAVIVRGRHFEHLTFEAIAARCELSVNTVKSRYYRALQKLRRWFMRRAGEGEA